MNEIPDAESLPPAASGPYGVLWWTHSALTVAAVILSFVIVLVPTVVAFNILLEWNGVGWGAAGSWVAGIATLLAVIAAFHASAGAKKAASRQIAHAQAALKIQMESEQYHREIASCVELMPVLLNLSVEMDRADRKLISINSTLATFDDQSPDTIDWEDLAETNAQYLNGFRETASSAYTKVLFARLTVQSQEFRQLVGSVERQVMRVNSYLQTWYEQIVINNEPAHDATDTGWAAAIVGDQDLHDAPAPAVGVLRDIVWAAQDELRQALLSMDSPNADDIL